MRTHQILRTLIIPIAILGIGKSKGQSIGGSFGSSTSNGLRLTHVIGQTYSNYYNKNKSSVILSQGQILPKTFSIKSNIDYKIQCFPNPFTHSIKVQSEKGQIFDGVQLIDLRGRTVSKIHFTGSDFKEMNLDHLVPGVYMLQVLSGNNNLHTQQIIKSK